MHVFWYILFEIIFIISIITNFVMVLTMESYKLLSSDKKDDIKMDIINHYRKHIFLYDYRNSDYINRDL